jgi:uncharacterized membrane protein HdeD (DUF308 family)
MTTTDLQPAAGALRRLYFTRFGFAIVWAVLLVVSTAVLGTAGTLGPLTIVLLVLYPLFDLASAVVDRRSTRAARPSVLLIINMVLSLATVIGLVFAVMSGAGAVLLVWGLWAITAGLVQLIVGISRRALGGQWAMIIAGGISVLAGGSFVASSASGSSVAGIAGYAVLGGIFFLISALRLRRVATGTATTATTASGSVR